MSDRTNNLRDELLALRTEAGLINPRTVVGWARTHENSALHGALNWDDADAAEEYRVWQVRNLIALHVVSAGGSRMFVSLSVDRKSGGYRLVDDIAEQPDLREIMLNDALAELERVQHKYKLVKELEKVWAQIEKTRKQIESKQRPRNVVQLSAGTARRGPA